MTRPLWKPALCVAALTLPNAAQAQVIVTSVPAWNGTDGTGVHFGTPTTLTMGESFTNSPNYGSPNAFTFNVRNNTANAFSFQAYVHAWTGTAITGSALFTSAPVTVVGNNITPGFQALTVSTGAVSLTPGGQYVALFSIGSGSGLSSSWARASGAGSFFFGGKYVYTSDPLSPSANFTLFERRERLHLRVHPGAGARAVAAAAWRGPLGRRRPPVGVPPAPPPRLIQAGDQTAPVVIPVGRGLVSETPEFGRGRRCPRTAPAARSRTPFAGLASPTRSRW